MLPSSPPASSASCSAIRVASRSSASSVFSRCSGGSRHGSPSGRSPSSHSWSATVERQSSSLYARMPSSSESLLRLEPLLEEDDRLVAARDLGRALEPVQLLDLLDRVARDAGAQRLPDDAVEVDEQLLPQPVVDLALARRVLAHEAPQRRALVARRSGRRAGRGRRGGAPRPSRRSARRPPSRRRGRGPRRPRSAYGLPVLVAVAPAEQILEPARRLVERVALEVEPDVASTGGGSVPEAAVLLVREELDAPLAGAREVELERGLRSGSARTSPAGCASTVVSRRGLRRAPSASGSPRAASRSACSRPSPATRIGWSSATRWSWQRWRKSQIVQW